MAKAKQVKTREEVTNIQQPTEARLSEGVVEAGRVKVYCRPLTFWELQYIDVARRQAAGTVYRPDGTVLIEGDQAAEFTEIARLHEKLGIDRIEGMPAEFELKTVAGRKIEVVSDSTLEMFPGPLRNAIAVTVQNLTALAEEEKAKLDFFTPSAETSPPSATEPDATAVNTASSP